MDIIIHVDSGIHGLTFKRPSLVKKQFADECDLSKIVARFIRTGELPNLAVKTPLPVEDVSQLPEDFQALQEWKVQLSNAFEAEPLEIRELFQHSTERYAEFKALPEEQQEFFIKQHLSGGPSPDPNPKTTFDGSAPPSPPPLSTAGTAVPAVPAGTAVPA